MTATKGRAYKRSSGRGPPKGKGKASTKSGYMKTRIRRTLRSK